MSHKKLTSFERLSHFKNQRVEFGDELSSTEINATIASENEAKFSKKTRNKHHKRKCLIAQQREK